MNSISEISQLHKDITLWRRDLHAHPELAFNENRTAAFVAEKLQSWGIRVTTGVGQLGVVGSLTVGTAKKSIGLRADMDALPMQEMNNFSHKSTHEGKMHGCGHDGHTCMLLAAAQYLAKSKQFNGTVHFIFQPAEEANENGSGACAMIDDGLFERFPMDHVFGMHNLPGIPAGTFAICPGPVMAAMDLFNITISGHGTHGALPHTGKDAIYVSAQMINAWQSIVSRNVDPIQSAVISATSIHGGNSWNVIPETVQIKGSIRTFLPAIQDLVQKQFEHITQQLAATYGVSVDIQYSREIPATINNPEMAQVATEVATQLVGNQQVLSGADAPKTMGSEDFAFMLKQRPGAYLWLGNGGTENNCVMLHESTYDFNDNLLPVGASFWVRLSEKLLPVD